ncbi:MAG: class I SAM-dependent methyltransferase [Dehalococcoidales bacterium]|nr:class I SAM-dependent methyltransferase [Dehalococcoidales bacterium]
MAENLQTVFNQIAPSWYNYRHHTIFRQELEKLSQQWHGGKLINLGCGHGADFLPFAGKFKLYGMDFSEEMIRLARKYAVKYKFEPNLLTADLTALPYGDDSFDYAIAVATYHHLKQPQRLPALRELYRIMKPGGYVFITVWNRRQSKFWFKPGELMVPWRTKQETLYRYYHLFTYGEIDKLVRQAGFEVEKLSAENDFRFPLKYFSRNICLSLKKA